MSVKYTSLRLPFFFYFNVKMSSNIYVHLENYFQEYGTLPNYPVIQRYKWNLCSANKQAPAPGRQVISISLLSV